MEFQRFDIDKANELFEADSKKYNLDQLKGNMDTKAKVLKDKNAESYQYMINNMFKTKDEIVAYFDNEDFEITREKYLGFFIKAIDKTLYRSWEMSTQFYKVIQDPKADVLVNDGHKRTLNTFPQPGFVATTKKSKTDISAAKKMLLDLWGQGKADNQTWIINYLRWLLKSERTEVIPYLMGAGGDGKSSILKLVRAMVGERRSCPVSLTQWASNFNNHLVNKFFLYTDETPEIKTQVQRGSISQSIERMKNNSTDKIAQLELKGKDTVACDIFVNIWFSSNFALTENEMIGRRLRIFPIANLGKVTTEEFIEVGNFSEHKNEGWKKYIQTVVNWIVNTDFSKEIEGFVEFTNCNQFQTWSLAYCDEFKAEIKGHLLRYSYSKLPEYINTCIVNKAGEFLIPKKTFFDDVMMTAKQNNFSINASTIKQDLMNIGVEVVRKTGNVEYLWIKSKEDVLEQLKKNGWTPAEKDEQQEIPDKEEEENQTIVTLQKEIEKLKKIIEDLKKVPEKVEKVEVKVEKIIEKVEKSSEKLEKVEKSSKELKKKRTKKEGEAESAWANLMKHFE